MKDVSLRIRDNRAMLTKFHHILILPMLLLVIIVSAQNNGEYKLGNRTIKQLINIGKNKVRRIHRRIPYSKFPHAGECPTCKHYNQVKPNAWVSGFLNGMFMQFYDWDKASTNPMMAEEWMERFDKRIPYLAKEQFDKSTHDVGFKIFYSYGHAYKSTGYEKYLKPVINAAHSLATRYNSKVNAIKSWDTEKYSEPARSMKWPVIIDNMMNLEMLLWASNKTNNATLKYIALKHSTSSMRDLIRSDGCPWHAVDYQPSTGSPKSYWSTPQGYNKSSIWTRGCAFAIHGFTTVFKWSKDQRFLEAAMAVSECFLSHLSDCCPDHIPPSDFHDPEKRPDSSAGAIAALCALRIAGMGSLMCWALTATNVIVLDRVFMRTNRVHLSQLVAPHRNGISERYLTVATNILRGLSLHPTNDRDDYDGLLMHGMGDFGKKDEDVSLIYGDYFFIQALCRLAKVIPNITRTARRTREGSYTNEQIMYSITVETANRRYYYFTVAIVIVCAYVLVSRKKRAVLSVSY
eukprot:CFRG5517T1